MSSLRGRLIVVWVLSLLASLAMGSLLVQLFQQSAEARVQRAQAVVAHACDLIRDRFSFYSASWTGGPAELLDQRSRADLAAAVGVALAHEEGVEGGIWAAGAGPLAYAYPTYPGSGPKTDLPAAEQQQIRAINQAVVQDEQPADKQTVSGPQTLLLHACPLPGSVPGLTGWTMTRVQAIEGLGPLQLGLGVLLALMVAMSAWLGRTLFVWRRHVGRIEAALRQADDAERMPVLPRTRERELDQIIDALNEAGRKLAAARAEADRMAARAARAERLAGLGRVAAGIAHEIRNPIAAARLQGENALAGDDARRRAAIGDMLRQIDRLDALVSELLAMTQRVTPVPQRIELGTFLAECLDRHRPVAAHRGVTLKARNGAVIAAFDPALVGRILDNLLSNAIRHSEAGGVVQVVAETEDGALRLAVADEGAGVAPELAGQLFEPFVTGRPDGTGLGLAIARELADAHGAALTQVPAGRGATFRLEIPGAAA